jgi:hypothetical protein
MKMIEVKVVIRYAPSPKSYGVDTLEECVEIDENNYDSGGMDLDELLGDANWDDVTFSIVDVNPDGSDIVEGD